MGMTVDVFQLSGKITARPNVIKPATGCPWQKLEGVLTFGSVYHRGQHLYDVTLIVQQ